MITNPYDTTPRDEMTPLHLPQSILQVVEDTLVAYIIDHGSSSELEFAIARLKGFDTAAELRAYQAE